MAVVAGCSEPSPRRLHAGLASAARLRADPEPAPAPVALAPPRASRWLAVGGGAEPVSNQVSIEQDLALARATLGDGGWTLFAGGPGRAPVQVLADRPAGGLAQRLGHLFDPRDGRGSRYRPSRLGSHGPANLDQLERAWSAPGEAPWLVLIAGHGEQGPRRADAIVRLWGGEALTVTDLDDLTSDRPTRLLMGTCFSGGFAELAFAELTAPIPTTVDRCGLFASTWDREASGCDPNPDRRLQESYLLHVLHALQGEDREGRPLASLDLDHDGSISLLEAHARARIAQRAYGVPTTTSERLLEVTVELAGGERETVDDWPEEAAVVEQLPATLGIEAPHLDDVWRDLGRERERLLRQVEERQAASDDRWLELRIALLERWPVLDDPYHPAYAGTLVREGASIEAFLDRDPRTRTFLAAEEALAKVVPILDDVERRASLVLRWRRARDNLRRAAVLRRRGGEAWDAFRRTRRCERFVPRR